MKPKMGRPALYAPKDTETNYQVKKMTRRGAALFEAARKRIAKLREWAGRVSDADCLEAVLRGDDHKTGER